MTNTETKTQGVTEQQLRRYAVYTGQDTANWESLAVKFEGMHKNEIETKLIYAKMDYRKKQKENEKIQREQRVIEEAAAERAAEAAAAVARTQPTEKQLAILNRNGVVTEGIDRKKASQIIGMIFDKQDFWNICQLREGFYPG